MQIHSLNVKVAEVVGVNKALLLQYIEFWGSMRVKCGCIILLRDLPKSSPI